ncbi:ankyrin repeat protein [Cotia virus SPAn232]|uniref:Ankyrin repeat protein n=2 Tax=Cotia virus TaxID=39444 RepID=H6TAD0_9POXV|nr:ankyrin repeat protein [Cotia virus SPAn232]AFB76964.1 ankyrin repeat protein [Cotia virus SPAn232]AIT70777.1 ankyrin repeat protein [Cotia virus]
MYKYKVFSALENNNYITLKNNISEYINIYNIDDNYDSSTNLIMYYLKNENTINIDIIKLILIEYKNKNINDNKELYLHEYIDRYYDKLSCDIIKMFVDYRSNILNEVNENGNTPFNLYMYNISYLKYNINFDIVKTFLTLGSDLSIYNSKNYTPIHTYILSANINKKILDYLLGYINPTNEVFKNMLNIYLSKQKNFHSIKVIKKLLPICKNVISNGYNSIMCYVKKSPVIKVKIIKLLSYDCDINYVNEFGETSLDLYLCSNKPKIEIVKYLIGLGATIKQYKNYNKTALHKYITNEKINKEILKYLISLINYDDITYHSLLNLYLNNRYKFDLDIIQILSKICLKFISPEGNTSLMSYFISDPDRINLKIVKMLATDLDIDYKNSFNETTFDIYMLNCEDISINVLKFFIDSGVKIKSKKKIIDMYLFKRDEACIDVIDYILNNIPSTLEDENIKTYPLHSYMESANDHKIVEYIISNLHCNVNEYNDNGYTPLHVYLNGFNNETDIIDTLINMGADVNLLTSNGETSLYLSLFRDKKQIKTLITSNPSHDTVIKTIDYIKKSENEFMNALFESSLKEFISYAILINNKLKDKLIELVNFINMDNNIIVHINNCYNAIINLNGIIVSQDKITAYDLIINKNINRILNENILKNINPSHYYVYNDIVFESIRYAIYRQNLLYNEYSSVNYSRTICEGTPPDELKDNIFGYMDNEDI